VETPLHQRGFPKPRLACDEYHLNGATQRPWQQAAELGELALSPHCPDRPRIREIIGWGDGVGYGGRHMTRQLLNDGLLHRCDAESPPQDPSAFDSITPP
jgi:hypothetical protein